MQNLPLPDTVVLEFLTWVLWFVVFLALQRQLCRHYPGIRTLCRMLFLSTAAIAILPGFCALLLSPWHGARLLALVNHVFGMGILAQTSVRALFLLRWLAWSGPQSALSLAGATDFGLATERYLVASLLALTQVVRLSRVKPSGKS